MDLNRKMLSLWPHVVAMLASDIKSFLETQKFSLEFAVNLQNRLAVAKCI